MKTVSIVIPVFNEENIVEELIFRLKNATHNLRYSFEFVLVDDGSSDNTLKKVLAIQNEEPRLKIVKLSRNWGFQNAYNAGLEFASGDCVILMDGDLEDPPELIPEFLKKWEEGFDVVYAVKETRYESKFKKLMFHIFYKLMKRFSELNIDEQAGMFSLIDRKVVCELKKFKEKSKYYVGLRFFIGFNQTKIFYHRDKRFAGVPKQTFRKLVNYALNAFFSFSFLPIRLLTYFGIFLLLVIILISIIFSIIKIWGFVIISGWISIVLLILWILAVQIIFMGIIGEYVARIFDEVRNRPYYIVENVFEFNKKKG